MPPRKKKQQPPKPVQDPSALYRYGSLGTALNDALDDLVEKDMVPPNLAATVCERFDRVMADGFGEKTKITIRMTGVVRDYNRIDDLYTFNLRDVKYKVTRDGRAGDPPPRVEIPLGKLKLVAHPRDKENK